MNSYLVFLRFISPFIVIGSFLLIASVLVGRYTVAYLPYLLIFMCTIGIPSLLGGILLWFISQKGTGEKNLAYGISIRLLLAVVMIGTSFPVTYVVIETWKSFSLTIYESPVDYFYLMYFLTLPVWLPISIVWSLFAPIKRNCRREPS